MSSVPRRKIGSRACDGCKIRKVKCSEVPPCTRCVTIGIDCTFNKRQATRGPRSLRAKTLAEIRTFQAADPGVSLGGSSPALGSDRGGSRGGTGDGCSGPEAEGTTAVATRTPVSSLIVRLCLYNRRLFPVWPILNVDDLIGSLLHDPADVETYVLANAVCAAIIAQLKLPFEGRTDDNDPATAAFMAAECQRAKASLQANDDGPEMNLNMLRIAFFQHIYHENQSPGGGKSLLFLREAVSIAQIMGLHHQSTYTLLPAEEQQMRANVIWLLFITERGVAMLHKLPTVLTWQRSFPPLDRAEWDQDEAHVLPAFKRLVELFWTFDQGGAFDLIQTNDTSDAERSARLNHLQQRLQEMVDEEQETNEVQKADILVTRSWMQTMLWRASTSEQTASVVLQPYRIIGDFLSNISRYSKNALEAHGPTIELKIYEIASALTDALSANLDLLRSSLGLGSRPVDMLIQLQRLLASSRGGNKTLLTLLCSRIAEIESNESPKFVSSPPDLPSAEVVEVTDGDGDGENVLQSSGRVITPRRMTYPLYVDSMLEFPEQLTMWPDAAAPGNCIDIDAYGNIGPGFVQLTSESWNGWAIDLN